MSGIFDHAVHLFFFRGLVLLITLALAKWHIVEIVFPTAREHTTVGIPVRHVVRKRYNTHGSMNEGFDLKYAYGFANSSMDTTAKTIIKPYL